MSNQELHHLVRHTEQQRCTSHHLKTACCVCLLRLLAAANWVVLVKKPLAVTVGLNFQLLWLLAWCPTEHSLLWSKVEQQWRITFSLLWAPGSWDRVGSILGGQRGIWGPCSESRVVHEAIRSGEAHFITCAPSNVFLSFPEMKGWNVVADDLHIGFLHCGRAARQM